MTDSQSGRKKAKARQAENAKDVNPPERSGSNASKTQYDQIIFRDWCKACGICSAFCPKKVIGRDESGSPVVEKPEACIGCRFCELHCPDFAITIREKENGSEKTRNGS